jgi:hypothetical protein
MRKSAKLLGLGMLGVMLAGGLMSCHEGAGERAGRKMDRAARDAKTNAEDMRDDVKDQTR